MYCTVFDSRLPNLQAKAPEVDPWATEASLVAAHRLLQRWQVGAACVLCMDGVRDVWMVCAHVCRGKGALTQVEGFGVEEEVSHATFKPGHAVYR